MLSATPFLFLTLLGCLTGTKNSSDCSLNIGADQAQLGQFYQSIERIQKHVVDLTSHDDLFLSTEFITIYEHPDIYYPYAIATILNRGVNDTNKQIVIYSMTKLPDACFLDIVDTCYDHYNQGDVNSDIILSLIGHNFGKHMKFYESAKTKKGKDLMRRMLNDKKLPNDVLELLERIGDREFPS